MQNSMSTVKSMSNGELLRLENVSKSYTISKVKFTALKDVSLSIKKNEFLTITGRSGSGKSTLLNMISGIDRPSTGSVYYKGIPIHQYSEDDYALWRGTNIGIVFQFFQLIPSLTVIENILMAMEFNNKIPKKLRLSRAKMLLERVGISNQENKLPSTLSGGQQQRAAIARSLANDPDIIIADEPTGNLDFSTSLEIIELFKELLNENKTIIIVSHDRDLAKLGSRSIQIEDGVIIGEKSLEEY